MHNVCVTDRESPHLISGKIPETFWHVGYLPCAIDNIDSFVHNHIIVSLLKDTNCILKYWQITVSNFLFPSGR